MMIRFLTVLAALLVPAFAPAAAQTSSDQPHTRIEILAASASPTAGKPITIGLMLTPKADWHTYWINPGDAGAPTRVEWTLPAGTEAPGELAYPIPETLIVSGLMNYVYSHPNVLITSVTPPASLKKGDSFPVTVKADWLVCSMEQCVPESATLSLPLTIGDGDPDTDSGSKLAAAQSALPKPVTWAARYKYTGDRVTIAVPFGTPKTVRAAYFFPLKDGALDYAAPQSVTIAGDQIRIETKAGFEPSTGPLSGLLRVEREGDAEALGFTITAQPGDVPAAGTALANESKDGSNGEGDLSGLLPVLLLAVLGGIVLNVMPCVFPILSLKALSLAKGNIAPADARRDAMAYTAGVVLVCAALGALVIGLRAAGSQVGWAFQLQDPRVIAGLLLLVTAIALNLAGVFEINLTTGSLGSGAVQKGGAFGSFATGALAAFVATPCTGPFMAGALGAALVLPPAAGILVFAGLGFGLAIPFLLVGFVPAVRRRLPKPGTWMIRLRAILSVPMFLTALALAWVLGRQAGVEGMTAGLAGALLLGLLLWWVGFRQHGGATSWLPAGAAIAVSIAAIVLLPISDPAAASGGETSGATTLAALPYTPEKLADLRAARTPTFVYMTADWCLTCKVNEKGAMSSAAVAEAFKAKGITVLEGDWTRGDPKISAWLAEQGRAGVPVYMFYAADGTATELPQILTVDTLTALAG